jgi:hypothetical protein
MYLDLCNDTVKNINDTVKMSSKLYKKLDIFTYVIIFSLTLTVT